MMYAKVKEHKEYVRDLENQAILNVDNEAVQRHEKIMMDINRDKSVQTQINSLREDIFEIKELLKAFKDRG